MSSEKLFVPQFGPNGAVVNAPDMTDKMRAELEGAATPPTRERLVRDGLGLIGFIVFVLAGAALFTSDLGRKIYDAMKTGKDPRLAGWVTGAATVLFIVIVVSSIIQGIRRWEIMQPAEGQRLILPPWMRWAMFLTYVSIVVAACAVCASFLLLPGDEFYFLKVGLLVLSVGLNVLKGALIHLANRKGWTWRQPSTA